MITKLLRIIIYTLLMIGLFSFLFPSTAVSPEVVSLFVLVAIALDYAILAIVRFYKKNSAQSEVPK